MVIGVIGGSGLYQLDEAVTGQPVTVDTPYGKPSGPIYQTKTPQNTLLFMARHGEHHSILPSEINYRANLFALKKLGAERVLSISAVGSLKEEIRAGDFVLPDQYLDLTKGRPSTFFGKGIVGHLSFGDPTCPALREHILDAAAKIETKAHRDGIYVCIEGPTFSTRAESHWYRSWDLAGRRVSIVGMTAMPEARLAREAGLCYQTVAMATDYDSWKSCGEEVSVEAVMKVMRQNVSKCRSLLTTLATSSFPSCRSHCSDLVKNSVLTPKEHWPESQRNAMQTLLQ